MAKKVEKLKKLYVQNGGSAADVAHIKRTGDMIDALAELELGGGGGNNNFVVTYTIEDETTTADKTLAEIKAAISGGKNVSAIIVSEGDTNLLRLIHYDDNAVMFSMAYYSITDEVLTYAQIDHGEAITFTAKTITAT